MTQGPQRLLGEGMLRNSLLHPQKTALIFEGESYSYGQLRDGAFKIAAHLVSRGISRGDRVAIFMDNTWPCVLAIYGALLAGAVFVLINPQTKHDKLKLVLTDSEAKILITDRHLENIFLPTVPEVPTVQSILVSGKNAPAGYQLAIPYDDFFAVLENTKPLGKPVFTIPNDLAALIYTSGSTGVPKGVMQTHQSMVFAAWSLIEYLRLSDQDRILLALPFSFDYGLYQLLMAMKLSATLIVERSFTFPAGIYQKIIEHEATVFPGVPTIFSIMIGAHQKKPLCFPTVTRVTNTAAVLPAGYVPALKEIFPNALIYKMYGLTECKRVSYLEPELIDIKPDSVGKAIPGTETFLLSPDGKPVPLEAEGILHVRGPHVMAGYWHQPEKTSKMLKDGKVPGERILCTNDWFRTDDEGFLYFVSRTDDIIKTRGEKVSPLEVENVLHDIPGVLDAAVIGVFDETLGQLIYAVIVANPAQGLTEKKIKKICLAKLENFMVPQQVIFIEEMPKTPNGKIDKNRLIERTKK